MGQKEPVTGERAALPAPVRVLGMGNLLLRDDGVGCHAIERIQADGALPPEVEVLDIGTPGLALVDFLWGAGAVVLVDTIRAAAAPGTVICFDRDQILAQSATPRTDPHQPGLLEALATVSLAAEKAPEFLLVGVVPAEVTTGIGLSPQVVKALPEVVATVIAAVATFRAAPGGGVKDHLI